MQPERSAARKAHGGALLFLPWSHHRIPKWELAKPCTNTFRMRAAALSACAVICSIYAAGAGRWLSKLCSFEDKSGVVFSALCSFLLLVTQVAWHTILRLLVSHAQQKAIPTPGRRKPAPTSSTPKQRVQLRCPAHNFFVAQSVFFLEEDISPFGLRTCTLDTFQQTVCLVDQ